MGRFTRFAAGAGVATLVATLIGSPAYAADRPDLFVSFTSEPVAEINVEGTTVGMYVYNYGQAVATDVTLTINALAVADKVNISVPDFPGVCRLSGAVVTCQIGTLDIGQVDTIFPITLAAKPRAAAGHAGDVTITIDGAEDDANPADNTTTFPVTIIPSGPDLVALIADVGSDGDRVGPGDRRPLHAALFNEGDQAAPGFSFTFSFPGGATVADRLPGCTYEGFPPQTPPAGYIYGPFNVTCVVPEPLEPDEGVALFDVTTGESLFDVVFGKNIPGPDTVFGSFEVRLVDDGDVADAKATAGGRSLATRIRQYQERLAERPTALSELDESDNVAFYRIWTRPNRIDIAVSVPAVTANVGDVVDVAYVIVNNGPSDGGGPGFEVTAPSGTVFLPSDWCITAGTPGEQRPESTKLVCVVESEFPTVHSGWGTYSNTLRVRVKSTPTTDGVITVRNAGPATEYKPENNTARIVIDTGLAVTGARAGVVALAGALAVALGAILILVARRRRASPRPIG